MGNKTTTFCDMCKVDISGISYNASNDQEYIIKKNTTLKADMCYECWSDFGEFQRACEGRHEST